MQTKQEGQTTKHLINNVTFKKTKNGLTSTARLIKTHDFSLTANRTKEPKQQNQLSAVFQKKELLLPRRRVQKLLEPENQERVNESKWIII